MDRIFFLLYTCTNEMQTNCKQTKLKFKIMMNLNDLMGVVTIALEENSRDFNTWFINFSGHVNTLYIDFNRTGWSTEKDNLKEQCRVKLDENGIQEAYWFINNRLIK